MFRGNALVRLLLIAVALWFVGGSSAAALACVSPDMQTASAMPMKSDCPEMPKAHDRAAACAPMCAAIPVQVACVDSPEFDSAPAVEATIPTLPLRQIAPDPPPPRFG